MKEKDRERNNKNYFWYAGIGIDIAVTTLTGGVIGYFIDKYFHTTPVFLLLFIIMGFIAGILQVLKLIEREEKRSRKE